MAHSDYILAGYRQMLGSDLMGGTITYAGAVYPASISTFTIQQLLRADGGGFTPSLMAEALLALGDLPETVSFKRGQYVTASPSSGSARECQVESVNYLGNLVSITLIDKNQKS